jgi:hypothetical protein
MTIEEFWNQAFLVCLARVPPRQAKQEADEATAFCIEQWQSKMYEKGIVTNAPRWQDQNIGFVPMHGEDYRSLMLKVSKHEGGKSVSTKPRVRSVGAKAARKRTS